MEGRSFANPWTTSTHVPQPYYLTSLGSLYEIRAQIISGSSDDMISFSGSSFETWHSLNPTNGDRIGWYIRPGRPSVTLGISIRNLSGTITSTAQFVIVANQVTQSGPPPPPPPTTPTTPPPVINSFTFDGGSTSRTAVANDNPNFEFSVSGTSVSLAISDGTTSVLVTTSPTAEIFGTVSSNKTFTLFATNDGGTVTATVSLTIEPAVSATFNLLSPVENGDAIIGAFTTTVADRVYIRRQDPGPTYVDVYGSSALPITVTPGALNSGIPLGTADYATMGPSVNFIIYVYKNSNPTNYTTVTRTLTIGTPNSLWTITPQSTDFNEGASTFVTVSTLEEESIFDVTFSSTSFGSAASGLMTIGGSSTYSSTTVYNENAGECINIFSAVAVNDGIATGDKIVYIQLRDGGTSGTIIQSRAITIREVTASIAPPVINSFTFDGGSTSRSVIASDNPNFEFSVSGTSVSLEISDGTTSVPVTTSPTAEIFGTVSSNKTFTLTATNGEGSVTANVTLTVEPAVSTTFNLLSPVESGDAIIGAFTTTVANRAYIRRQDPGPTYVNVYGSSANLITVTPGALNSGINLGTADYATMGGSVNYLLTVFLASNPSNTNTQTRTLTINAPTSVQYRFDLINSSMTENTAQNVTIASPSTNTGPFTISVASGPGQVKPFGSGTYGSSVSVTTSVPGGESYAIGQFTLRANAAGSIVLHYFNGATLVNTTTVTAIESG
jgi:hypothetical protein